VSVCPVDFTKLRQTCMHTVYMYVLFLDSRFVFLNPLIFLCEIHVHV